MGRLTMVFLVGISLVLHRRSRISRPTRNQQQSWLLLGLVCRFLLCCFRVPRFFGLLKRRKTTGKVPWCLIWLRVRVYAMGKDGDDDGTRFCFVDVPTE